MIASRATERHLWTKERCLLPFHVCQQILSQSLKVSHRKCSQSNKSQFLCGFSRLMVKTGTRRPDKYWAIFNGFVPKVLARAFHHWAWGACGGLWPSKLKLCLMSAQRLPFSTKAGNSTYCLNIRNENTPWKPSQFLTKFIQLSCLKWSYLSDILLFSIYVSSFTNISFCSLKITLKLSFQNDRALKLQTQCSNSSECW